MSKFTKDLSIEDKFGLRNSLIFGNTKLFLSDSILKAAERTRKTVLEVAKQKAVLFGKSYATIMRLNTWQNSTDLPGMGKKPVIPHKRPAEMARKAVILPSQVAASTQNSALTPGKRWCS